MEKRDEKDGEEEEEEEDVEIADPTPPPPTTNATPKLKQQQHITRQGYDFFLGCYRMPLYMRKYY